MRINMLRANRKPILIGLAGGSASGKTSIAQILYNTFKPTNSVTIIREDDYYKDQSHLTFEERKKTNYDHPFAFDHMLMTRQLDELIAGYSISKPTYDYTMHNRSDITERIEPSDVIIIEGLFVLEEKEIRDKLDIKVFVDTAADIRFIRRLIRDVKERGRDLDNVVEQYTTTVRVMHDDFVEPSKKYADIIIVDLNNIETYPTHIAGLPVAVNINCHATRHKERVL